MKTLKVPEEKPDCRNTHCKYHRKGNKCVLGYRTCRGCEDLREKSTENDD